MEYSQIQEIIKRQRNYFNSVNTLIVDTRIEYLK